ncbi:hypothetical protein O6H91_06G075800 [Diphasiastrum complanatum]|uniref:Uncharacterized protein n=1 Tax=Diphasiastrum complanatum TaxID=34168 RepID=A0ACC2DF79_DIPCM|nr:hypothetical protein O6H91_Y380700 [Diphasiastrum complanatum]KAJ7552904.1 hypothetical protein O6H91_06G075800 [Diphasiastrum complanatum]
MSQVLLFSALGLKDKALLNRFLLSKFFSTSAISSIKDRSDIMHMGNVSKQSNLREMVDSLDRSAMHVAVQTYASLLLQCSKMGALFEGKRVHAHISRCGRHSNQYLSNLLINMYGKCGALTEAQKVLDTMPEKNVYSWTTMITSYAQFGKGEEALEVFDLMRQEGVKPDKITFVSLLKACSDPRFLREGKLIHSHLVESGLSSDTYIGTALFNMYGKWGDLEQARKVFDTLPERSVVSWNAMMAAYAQHGHAREALQLYEKMKKSCVEPDTYTFTIVMNACADLSALRKGKLIHAFIVESGLESDIVLENAILSMYGKCGSLIDARRMFDQLHLRDVISWNIMIAAYGQHGEEKLALQLYEKMRWEGVPAITVTFLSILDVCATLGSLSEGVLIHEIMIDSGLASDISVGNALINMYGKCGNLEKAQVMFETSSLRDQISWGAILALHAQHGHGKFALHVLGQMQWEGLRPDKVAYVSIFSACSHAGLLENGCHYFDSVSTQHGVEPDWEHYSCIIDLLGRAGRLDEAEDHINRLPCRSSGFLWLTLLGACKLHGDVERGKRIAKLLLQLDPQSTAPYLLLSNIYAAGGRWEEKARVRKDMEDRCINKLAGCSSIDIDGQVYEFIARDKLHPQIEEIHRELDRLSNQMKKLGYVPQTNLVQHDVDEEDDRECLLFAHSERLAVAFGLLRTPPATKLTVIKNLRVCDDCHAAFKFIAKISKRKIVVRDLNRFHHFYGGLCSCGDYW